MCFLPFLAGMNFSRVSVNNPIPTLSLFFNAENINDAATSNPNSFLLLRKPKSLLADKSIIT